MTTKSSYSRKTAPVTLRTTGKAKSTPKTKTFGRGKTPKKTTEAGTSGKAALPFSGDRSPTRLPDRTEADLTTMLDSLNNQVTSVVNASSERAITQRGRQEPVIRTKPVDRATAMFQRLVAEVLDDKLAEVLPALVALRGEMNQHSQRLAVSALASSNPPEDRDFFDRGTAMLDQVLATLEVHPFQPRVGDPFDPLIHLAVGETKRDDLRDGVMAEVLSPGFRTARGKVIVTARVMVNRR